MKKELLLTFITLCLCLIGFAQPKGCFPIHQYQVQAKVYNSAGIERVDQSCTESYIMWSSWDTYDYNDYSNDGEWVVYLNPGDTFKLNCKSASEYSSTPDFGLHSITILTGELFDYQTYGYTGFGGSCNHSGAGIVATFADSASLVVQNPFDQSNSGKLSIFLKRSPEEIIEDDKPQPIAPFISQTIGTNQALVCANSDLEQTLEVYSLSGKLIKSMSVMDKQSIELQELPPGLYILRSSVNGHDLIGKFIRH